ncbi:MAG TPA: EAL domain-containing protein [Nocardioidaceae bacterium]|jgi:EAL domain-containing protein (putative c-di-GMP-specific phosphodiesterase class I)|nr:EAL domain-containing protein [Nocardioidaceae bacterium]
MSDLEWVINDVTSHRVDGTPESSRRAIVESLVALRALLRMEVAFVSRFADGRRWFEFVDSDESFRPFEVGDSDPMGASYCARVVDGRVDRLIHDARQVPELRDLPVTTSLPVGAHLSVPIEGSDGVAMGTLCCFSRIPDPDLRERDLELMTVFAGLISRHLDLLVTAERRGSSVAEAVTSVITSGGPAIALQPIVDIATGTTAGYEALSRFPGLESWTPDRWFREADSVGLGPDLEASAVRAALREMVRLPRGTSLSVNVSARALCASDGVLDLLLEASSAQVVVELTEHDQIDDYGRLAHVLARVRRTGARVAVDDAGSGYAGLGHILRLEPEVLKLDRTLVEGIAHDPGRQAMCVAMVGFTQRMGSTLIAEGVETGEDLEGLADLGVPYAQGYFLGRPQIPEPRTGE